MAQPTFIQQFGPLFAALIALIGVALTLVINGRREASRNRWAREDEYRKEQRQALASVLVAAHNFRRDLTKVGLTEQWVHEGQERVLTLRNEADKAISELLNQLTIARLLVHSGKLQNTIDELYLQQAAISPCIHEIVDAFWSDNQEETSRTARNLSSKWRGFDDAIAVLQSVALDELGPTIISQRTNRIR
jgi:hypothetical protein